MSKVMPPAGNVEDDEEPARKPSTELAGKYSTQRSALETSVNAALDHLEALNTPGAAKPPPPASVPAVAPPTSGKRISLSALKAEEAKVFRASKKNFIGNKATKAKKPR